MRHVFVETNWVVGYAAPAHHKRLDAVELLQRSREGEVRLHLPAPCVTEARHPIVTKCQPRNEADAIRRFLRRARADCAVSAEEERVTRVVLDRFEQQVKSELAQLDEALASLLREPGVEIFALNERMLGRAVELAQSDLKLDPFDQAILAAILVRSEELRRDAELCFCEIDSDLQPWNRHTEPKQALASLYESAAVWVYGDFAMRAPERPEGWPGRAVSA